MSALVEATPRRELSILIVQLGEEADIFRSLMALKAIKHLYPECKISIVVRHEVSVAVKRIEWLSAVYETPQFNRDASQTLGMTALWVDKIIEDTFDVLVNWTFSKTFSKLGAITAALIPSVIKLGDYIREDMTLASYDAWSMYRQSWVSANIEQDIHTTDIITTQLLTALQIHAGDPNPDAGVSAVSSRYFFKEIAVTAPYEWALRPKNIKWIAYDTKSLNGKNTAGLVEAILRRHPDTGIVFLGEPQFSLASLPQDAQTRIVQISNDDLAPIHTDELIHIFSNIQWLISGESAASDLASLMNVRVMFILQTGQSWSVNGPYGNNHVVCETQKDIEISTQALYAAWSYYQSEWFHKGTFSLSHHFENIGCTADLPKMTIYRSRIRPPQEGGGVIYAKQGDATFTFEDWMCKIRGQMARAWFCGWLPPIDAEVAAMKLSPILIKRVRELQESIQVISKLCQQGSASAIDLFKNSEKIRSGNIMSVDDRQHVEEGGKKLLEVEALMTRVIQVEPELACILKFYQILVHNLNGETISQMAKETAKAFDLVAEGVELISVYAQKTLDRAKPKAIVSEKPLTLANDPT